MSTGSVFWKGNSMMARVRGVKSSNGTVQNDATVTMESMTDEVTGDSVTGITYPVALPYVVASVGDYEGGLPHDAGVSVGGSYLGVFKVVLADGTIGEWVERIRGKTRKG